MGSNVTTVGERAGMLFGSAQTFGQVGQTNAPALVPIAGAYDTGSIGFQMVSGWTKVVFQIISATPGVAFSGFTVTLYGSLDLATVAPTGWNPGGSVLVGAGSSTNWAELPAPSNQAESPGVAWTNPLTAATQLMYCNAPFPAYRALVTVQSPTGSIYLAMYGTP